MNKKYTTGFTIVELLVVIVVIGILASISVVAYSNIQKRAHSAVAVSARSAYVKALRLYKIDNGRYPIVATNGETVCLGSAADYAAKDGYAANQCRYSDYTAASTSLDTSISSELEAYMTSNPSVSWPPATETYSGTGIDYFRGIFYYSGMLANQGRTAYIWYYLPRQNSCPTDGYGGYNADTGETQCTVYLD